VQYADDTTYGQSIGTSLVHRGDLSGGDEPQETANTWADGDCLRGDGAGDYRGGRHPAEGRPAGLGSNCWIGGDARGGDCGVVAHARAETRKYGNVRAEGFKALGCVGGKSLKGAQPGMAVPQKQRKMAT